MRAQQAGEIGHRLHLVVEVPGRVLEHVGEPAEHLEPHQPEQLAPCGEPGECAGPTGRSTAAPSVPAASASASSRTSATTTRAAGGVVSAGAVYPGTGVPWSSANSAGWSSAQRRTARQRSAR